ncbi:MAG: LamG-like jellyroll fold domain-containing protein [Syntrophales bacterium]
MYRQNFVKAATLAVVVISSLLIGGALNTAAAFSVDVRKLYYADYMDPNNTRRVIDYDFSGGSISGNTIAIPSAPSGLSGAGVLQAPSIDGGLTYTFEPYPDPSNDISASLSTANKRATLISAANGGLIINTTPYPSTTLPVPQWTYTAALQNFAGMTDPTQVYAASVGFGSMTGGPHPEFSAAWVPASGGGRDLILRAQIYDDSEDVTVWGPFETSPISGFDPASGIIALRIRCLDPAAGGNSMIFDYSLDRGLTWTAVGTDNFGFAASQPPAGFPYVGFPGLFPYVALRAEAENGGGEMPPFQAFSNHEQGTYGYFALIFANDPGGNLYSGVTAESVNIAPGSTGYLARTSLGYGNDQWWVKPDISLGMTLPTVFPTYHIVATKKDGGTVVVDKTITGYISQFVTVTSPAANASLSAPPTFSWTWPAGAPAVNWYGIDVRDATLQDSQVMGQYNLPASTTSVPYSGVPLVNGHSYRYTITAADFNGNTSQTYGSFTYNGAGATTISFNGWALSAPDWPNTTNMAPVFGTNIGAYTPGSLTPINTAYPDGNGAFNLTDIPASSNFFVRVGPPAGYQVVLSKIMNWNSNIQALLPFALLTAAQYNALNTPGTSMIIGRVALKSNPATFLSGATVTATQWLGSGTTSVTYPVTYTGGGTSTASDGIYMVKNVPAGTAVQLTAALAGYTFEFNNSIVPTAADHVSEDSFFATPTSGGGTVSFNGMLTSIDDNPVSGATVAQDGNAAVSTTTDSYGIFTLPGLPGSAPFTLKMTQTGYVPTYSSVMQATAGTAIIASRPFTLFPVELLNGWSGGTGRGVIRGRVVNSANPQAGYISGATVSYSSSQGHTYRVKYEDINKNLVDGATTANGRYYILDVQEGDTVTVSATHPNYTFPASTTFITHDGAMSLGIVAGTAVAGRVGIGGFVMNTASPPAGIKNATIEQIGATSPINATMSNPDGSFYLSVPAGTDFQLKLSKPQAIPTLAPSYTAQNRFGSDYPNLGEYNLFPTTKLSDSVASGGWNVASNKGIIRSRVVDQTLNNLSGAIVTAASANNPAIPYTICYDDACSGLQATGTDGRYIVRDVDDGDTVTVTATKAGYTFNSRIFPTHAGGVHQGRITGTAGTGASLSATGQTFVSAGMGSVSVVAPSGFGWSAVSNAPSWIHITAGSSGTGNGTVFYTVDANTGAARTGTMTIGGQTFTVTQTGVGFGFPIATTPGSEMGLSAAFDGTNYLVGIEGDAVSHNNITAQLVSPSGALVGSRISTGRTGGLPLVAFDGTNYLMIWFDDLVNTGKLYGVFISKAGVAGTPFLIDDGPLSVKRDIGGIAFGGGTYLAAYYKTDSTTGKDIVYGRLISPASPTSPAGVIGNGFRISTGFGSQAMQNVVFDGTNFFVVWNDHFTNNAVKGRFVSPSGTLGTEITVKASGYPNDNPLTVTFAGGKYLVAWTDQISATPNNWDVFGQFVTPTGALDGGKITISTALGQQFGPGIAFDGTNYLVSWTDLRNDANGNWACDVGEGTCMDIRGQFVSQSGALVGSEFIVNNDPGNQMGGIGGLPVNGKLFGLVNSGVALEMSEVGSGGVAGGDVYGMFMTAGEKIPMMSFTDSGMNLYLYDPSLQTSDTVVLNNQAGPANMNSAQTMLVYTKFLNEVPNNGSAYSPCIYNTVAKTTVCLTAPTVEEDSAAFDGSGKILFIDKVDGVLKKMNADGTNVVTVATPASPYRFTYFSLSPDRQKLMIVEESRGTDYYATNQSRLVLMNADGTSRAIVQDAVLGEWNMLVWKADSSRVFYYYTTFNGMSEPNVVETSHYAVFAVPGGARTDLSSSALGSAEGNVGSFTKAGNLLSWMNHNLYNGQTGALIATRTDVPTLMEARLGFGLDGEIYFANLDGTNFRKFVESTTQTWTVTPSAGVGGTISPNTPQTADNNATAQFTVTANSGYTAAVTGTCGGSLNGTTYTTSPVTANCTVSATFAANPVNGVCGAANGQAFTSAPTPTDNLCSVGTPTTVAGSGPWTWSCPGTNGGAAASCAANIIYQPWRDDFSGTDLNPAWHVESGTGSYSLTDNSGYLRYKLTGQAYSGHSVGASSSWSPSLALIRPFNGDNWVLNAKADYNIVWQGTGAQYQVFTVAFGAGNNAYLSITRGTDQWYNANILTAQLVVNGQAVAANNAMIAADDLVANNWLKHTYFYEIRRNGRCLLLRYSADGTKYKTALTYQLPPGIEASQRVIIDANVYSTEGSYVDWDYIDFAPTPIPNYGDINNDGRVDLADAVLAIQAVAGLNPSAIRTDYQTCGVDVDCNASIGTAEALYILQRAAGLREGNAAASSSLHPYVADVATVLLDHFDGVTTASILAYSENGAACGAAKPSAVANFSYVAGPSGLTQALAMAPPTGQPAGSATYLQYPDGQLLSQSNGTIEFWTYITSYGTGLSFVDQGPYYGSCAGWTFGMGVNAEGQLTASAWAAFDMNSGVVKLPLNQWTHVAATWGSGGAKLYINGVLVGSDANTGMPASGYSGSVRIRNGAHSFGGRLDELRISNVQRTDFPVKQ